MVSNLMPESRQPGLNLALCSKNTGPEIVVQRLLRQIGFTGYRIHCKNLPGKPAITFIYSANKAVFMHRCFWHSHNCKEGK